jgi:nicotinate-nucleotide--dimethylbenzimidazole phosphoribosyltransferase
MKGHKLQHILQRIQPIDERLIAATQRRLDSLTKPIGSLGRLEEIACRLVAMTGQENPISRQKSIIIIAADHGIAVEGVSAYPQEVTPQMVKNFLSGGAAINVLARHAGATVVVVDLGVAVDLDPHPNLVSQKIDFGTRNMAREPAMSREQAMTTIEAGIEMAFGEIERGTNLMGTGEMGIGNTTPSSAITAVFTGAPVAQVTGRGTGIDDTTLQRKIDVIQRAIDLHHPSPSDPIDVLAKVGGFEIGGIAGVILASAAHRVPIIVDGFISTAGALIAVGLHPDVRGYLISAHRSAEIGHQIALDFLKLEPILDLDLRLGEGTGVALAMPIVEASAKILSEMASFDEAGVSRIRK